MSVEIASKKIVYKPIPKAACTSVKAAIALVDPEPKLTEAQIAENTEIVHGVYKTSRYRPHRWKHYGQNGWWRFCVLRDPLKRLLSVYTNRVVELGELQNSPKIRDWTDLPVDPDPDEFFQNLEQYKEMSSVVRNHALSSALFVGPAPLRFDAVYKTSELGQLEADLSEKMGQAVRIPHFNSTEKPLSLSDLQPATIVALAKHLAKEYDHLSDYFDNPFASRPPRKRPG